MVKFNLDNLKVLYRNIANILVNWKTSIPRKPLLLRGARQVGKTYSVREFGATAFNGNLVEVNLEKHPEYHSIFDYNLDVRRIISELELVLGKKINPGDCLLFFDEIQECPKAIMALRYFYEDLPDLHVIAAGSLLEFALRDIPFPVGRLQMTDMYPMTYLEFLRARGRELLADDLLRGSVLSPAVLSMANDELRSYFLVGGMPECVEIYAKSDSYLGVFECQRDLLANFRQDFAKYAGHSDKRCLNQVLDGVGNRTGEQIKYSALAEDFSNPTIKKAFELLETARLYTRVKATSPDGIPLGIRASAKRFKTVFLDIGLMSVIAGYQQDRIIPKDKLAAVFSGKLAEQFVGQELRASFAGKLYYWSREARGSSAETDYLVEFRDQVLPIEVKSGRSGRLRSLHMLLESYPEVNRAVVFNESHHGILQGSRIQFLPLVYAGILQYIQYQTGSDGK